MRNKLASGGFVVAVTAIAVIAIMASCAKKIVNSPYIGVPIVISAKAFEAASPAQRPDSFMLTVDAKDIASRIVVALALENGYLIGQAVIPAGQARHFVVTALFKGVVMYRGEMTADVYPGAQLELHIDMHPVAPLLNITPHASRVTMDNELAVDINAYNLPRLYFISLRIACDTNQFGYKAPTIWIDSIVPGSGIIAANSRFSYHLAYTGTRDTATIIIGSVGNVATSILDSTGNGQLARVFFHTSSDYPFDTAPARLTLPPDQYDTYLRFLGDETTYYIGVSDTIHTDEAAVTMVRAAVNPSAPRLELQPRFQDVMMGDSFILDLNVFNEPNLQSIDVTLSFANIDSLNTPSPPMYIDSVIKGSDLDSATYVYYYQYNDIIQISINRGAASVPTTSILGPSGSGNLVKLHFKSYTDYGPDTAWVRFQYDNGNLYFPNGVRDPLPGGTVETNHPYVFLRKLIGAL